jgi:uncharacterized protein DUF5691
MNALLQTALLGTEKKNLDIHSLPQPLQDALLQSNSQDAEDQLLQAISYQTFFNAAGTTPRKLTGPLEETIIHETQPVAPDDLLQLFGKFELVDHQIRESLLNALLNVIHKRNEIVSPELVVSLIQSGRNMTSLTRSKIIQVIGNKGRWILQYDTSLNYTILPADDLLWNEGTTADRKQLFAAWRKADRINAWTRLHETWATESITSKKMFLEIILQSLSPEDIPFIERWYEEEFQYQPKEKKTEKECRRLLAAMLLHYPTTKLYYQTTQQLQVYAVKGRKGLIGMVTGKETVSFQLPESEDAFWNPSLMEQQYGFEVKSYDIARFNTIIQFWMAHFLQYLPMTFWSQAFDGDYNRTLQYWLTSPNYQTKINGANVAIFQQAMVEHIQQHQDSKTAAALVRMVDNITRQEVLSHMTPADFEAYVNNNNLYDHEQVLLQGPYSADQSWSQAFSEKIIAKAFDAAMQNNTNALLGKLIAQHAHYNSIDTLVAFNSKAHDTPGYHNWNTHIFQVAQPAFEIRNKINLYNK